MTRIERQEAKWLAAFGSSAPPGTIALDDQTYIDQTELTNFSWMEYEFWVRRIFGVASPEYRSVLPDTSVWENTPHKTLANYYYRHPAYKDYPVVGISYEQAKGYSKWRGDRVMEVYLIRAGVIHYREDQTKADHFSIERFYETDSLRAYHDLPFPLYTLPTYSEWLHAVRISDSLAHSGIRACKKLKVTKFRGATFTECSDHIEHGKFIINSLEVGGTNTADPVVATFCWRCDADLIWQLRGNIAELSNDSTVVLGGSWTDPLDQIILDETFPSRAPNASTGFRNLCQWRSWNGKFR